MACSFPQWRINMKIGWSILPPIYQKRIHNGGVIVQRPEYEFLVQQGYDRHEGLISQIPCGRCINCRLDYSRQWANRCVLEAKEYGKNNAFLTLTYEDKYLDWKPYFDLESGEYVLRPMLNKSDMQQFMKNFRFRMSSKFGQDNIRFFGCGEYGEKFLRPHFHILLFNVDMPAGKFWEQRENNILYRSLEIEDVWKKGICCFGDVTWDSCAYVSRYVMKKQKGKSVSIIENALRSREEVLMEIEDGQKLNIELSKKKLWQDEFVLMSRKPGIGRNFYDKHKNDIYLTDEVFVPKNGQIMPVKPCRYYDKLYDIDNPDRLQEVKQLRQQANKGSMSDVLDRTSLSEEQYLLLKDRSKQEQAVRLVRKLE